NPPVFARCTGVFSVQTRQQKAAPPTAGKGGCVPSALVLVVLAGFQRDDGVAAGQVDPALLVDVGHLDHDGVADGDHILHALHAPGVQLGDVDQALLAGGDLDEGAEVHQAGDFALVDGPDLVVLHD